MSLRFFLTAAPFLLTLASTRSALAQVADESKSGVDSCKTLAVQMKYSGSKPVCVMTLSCQEWTDGIQLRHFQKGEIAGCAPIRGGACPDDGVKCLADQGVTVEEMDHLTDQPGARLPPCDDGQVHSGGAAR